MPSAQGLQRSLRLLATTPNGAATGVLVRGLESDESATRVGAGRALAAREDRESHTELLRKLPGCRGDVRRAIAVDKVIARLRPAAVDAITGDDQDLCQQATRYAVEAEDHLLLPSIVNAATDPTHPLGMALASASLRLAQSLSRVVEARAEGRDTGRRDPAFARRGALESLGRAVDRFREHQRLELLDAFLTLTTYNNPTLKKLLYDPTHAAHGPLLESLMTCTGFGAMDVLISTLEDTDASQQMLEMAARRGDRPYVGRLLRRFGERPGVRVTQNARRLSGFGWAAPDRQQRLLAMPGPEQAAAMRLFVAADTTADERLGLASVLLNRGRDEGRAAACEALRRLKSPEVVALLKLAIEDRCPEVVAAAATQLRKHEFPNALTELVMRLDHPAKVVVAAAQRALGEFSLDMYRKAYARLTHEQRVVAGRLVGKADPEAADEIARDLRSGAVGRRLEALRLIGELAIVDRLVEPVVKLTKDRDNGVRAEAARVLGGCDDPAVVDVLTELLGDKSSGVRVAAEASLRALNSLDVADRLVEKLEGEFEGGAGGGALK